MGKLDEAADEILKEYAKSQDKSMRQVGILDDRRMGVVQRREIPLSQLKQQMKKKSEENG